MFAFFSTKNMATANLYEGFDFQLLNSPEFKEDAVREELISPILKKLGYKAFGHNRIIYSKTLAHPFVKIGSKKRQNPFSVLAGQLIINFIKKKTPKAIQRVNLGSDIYDLVLETIEAVIAKNDGASLEQINDELIMKGMEFGFLHILSKEYKDLTPILMNEYDYEQENEKFHIRKNMKFKTKIPLDMRIKYFLLSYMKRKETQGETPTTDDIILDIMPLLRNGTTPENQTILIVLRSIAEELEKDRWRIKQNGQMTFSF